MIDADLVRRKLALVIPDLEALERYAAMPLSEYLADPLHEIVVERYLERTIGRAIDVAFHLVTELGEPPPRDYYLSFLALGRLGVLPADLASALAPATGLRNRIAHEYDEIDPAIVHGSLARALPQLTAFVGAVERFLEAQSA